MEPSGTQSCPGACLAFSRTHKGLVLLGEIALCVLVLVCYGASRTPSYTGLAACELVFAVLVLLAWVCRLPPRLPLLHWGWTDFTRCIIGCLLFLITSLIVIIGHRDGAGIAAGVFGILAGILLGYDAYITLPTRQGHSAAPTESPDGA
ncbi:proteolipid protein 2 [Grus americana]|uniref:proteolipid protein 2 n=1 Tax=Grus americana TaxID=9117 RepID=UPI0020AA6C10|nr:proteolipid protein 2 [Grus americana]